MQERVELLGGRIAIESEPGRGTAVSVWFSQDPALPPAGQGDGEGRATWPGKTG
jgi:hypothetical protein